MMTDRELLEMAAKAAGIVIHRGSGWQSNMLFMPTVGDGTVTGVQWDPLDDDGDALRLAATLRLTVGDEDQSVRSMAFAYARHRQDLPHCYEPSQLDPAAAYRRAIVRAAAAMVGE